jgi:hypothetical protein
MTRTGARAVAQTLRFSLVRQVGAAEWRLTDLLEPADRREAVAYYTPDLQDAVDTMQTWRAYQAGRLAEVAR